jgi:hypothetical protein
LIILLAKRHIRTRREHNPILARVLLNDNIRCARRLALDSAHPVRINAFLAQSFKVVPAEVVVANVAHHGNLGALGSETSTCYSLVGAFASETSGERVGSQSFAGARHARSAGDEVDVERADYGD